MIDLRSDTVTRPSKEMLQAMYNAEVGDDVYGEDPTVIALQQKMANIFGMQAALFCPSGTMTNQIAIKAHTQPADEVICNKQSHIFLYEGGGVAFNSGVSLNLLEGKYGKITASQVEESINPKDIHHAQTKLVELENTTNKGGGHFYTRQEIQSISEVCKKHNLILHIDGARFFNALAETGEKPIDYAGLFDSISICLSKGLGAPIGSVLIGNADFIKKALRIRKLFGGAMRQVGYLAAAGIYALDNNIERLKEDHKKAREIAAVLETKNFVEEILPVKTNILIFKLKKEFSTKIFIEKLKLARIESLSLDSLSIRFVTHLDITQEMQDKILQTISEMKM